MNRNYSDGLTLWKKWDNRSREFVKEIEDKDGGSPLEKDDKEGMLYNPTHTKKINIIPSNINKNRLVHTNSKLDFE